MEAQQGDCLAGEEVGVEGASLGLREGMVRVAEVQSAMVEMGGLQSTQHTRCTCAIKYCKRCLSQGCLTCASTICLSEDTKCNCQV